MRSRRTAMLISAAAARSESQQAAMGAILSIFRGSAKEDEPFDIPIDFSAQPSAAETDVYNAAVALLTTAPTILNDLRAYAGCNEAIRQAISNPSKATEDAAWAIVCPAVIKLKDFYDFATSLEQVFPKLLQYFGTGEVPTNFERSQATAKKFADILDFATQFDQLKMANPNVQNDFSYYRRTVSRMKMNNAQGGTVISDDLANKMSLFFAHSSPMTKALIDSANAAVTMRTIDGNAASDIFAILAGISYNTISKSRTGTDGPLYFLRVMVISILIYDHVDPAGAFTKTSKISMKTSIKAVQTHGGSSTEVLLNALRYSTQHLNDETTPKNIKQMLTP